MSVHLAVFLAPCLGRHHSLDRLLLGDQFKAETFFLPYHLSLVLGCIVHLWAWPDGSGPTTRERQGEGVQWDPPPSPPPEVGVCLGLRFPPCLFLALLSPSPTTLFLLEGSPFSVLAPPNSASTPRPFFTMPISAALSARLSLFHIPVSLFPKESELSDKRRMIPSCQGY